jgi:hypothetical protein
LIFNFLSLAEDRIDEACRVFLCRFSDAGEFDMTMFIVNLDGRGADHTPFRFCC